MKILKLSFLCLILTAAVWSCTGDDETIGDTDTVTTDTTATDATDATDADATDATDATDDSDAAFQKEVLDAVNALRTAGCNCGAEGDFPATTEVTWNDKLEIAAKRHSDDMDKNSHFDHKGTDGSTVGSRVTDAGYPWKTVGENIANGYPDVAAVVKGWRDSDGHCANMMNAGFKEIAVVKTGTYWTMVLGAQ